MIIPDDVLQERNLSRRMVAQSMIKESIFAQHKDCDDSLIESESSEFEYLQELEEQLSYERNKLGRKIKRGHKYARITDQQRSALIDLVERTSCTIKSAAKQLKINNSTAKAILQVYKRDGRRQKFTRKSSCSQSQISQQANNNQGHVSIIEINQSQIRCLESEKEQLTQQVIEKDHIIKSLTDQSYQLSNQISALNEQKLAYQNQLDQMHYYYAGQYGQSVQLRNQYQFQLFK